MLLTADAWKAVERRPVADVDGGLIVGLDVGSSRAWSTAALLWRSGRLGALVVAPGVPDLAGQEARDAKAAGAYQRFARMQACSRCGRRPSSRPHRDPGSRVRVRAPGRDRV